MVVEYRRWTLIGVSRGCGEGVGYIGIRRGGVVVEWVVVGAVVKVEVKAI